jgi:hypothetical protein
MVSVRVRLPYAEAALSALFRRHGLVELEKHEASATVIEGKIPPQLVGRFSSYLDWGDSPPD